MNEHIVYKGVFAPYMEGYVRLKESCGFKIISTKWFFKEFDDFTIEQRVAAPDLTQELISTWALTRANDCSRTLSGKYSHLAQLARYMNERGIKAYITPVPKSNNSRGFAPYIFSESQMADIFKETDRLMRESKAESMSDLMKLSEEELIKLNEKLNLYNNFPQRDGKLIPVNPYLPYRDGLTKDVDILIGTNADEANYWIGEIGGIVPYRFSIPVKYENDLRVLSKEDKKRVKQFVSEQSGHSIWGMSAFYSEIMFRLPAIAQAKLHADNGGRSYMYFWTKPSVMRFCRACHAVELAYVFGNLDETIYTGERADETLSDTVIQMWTNFARTGDPSTDLLEWKPYSAENRSTMILTDEPHLADDVHPERRKQLAPLLKYMINASYATLDYNVPFVRKAAAIGLAGAAVIGGVACLLLINKDKKPTQKKNNKERGSKS